MHEQAQPHTPFKQDDRQNAKNACVQFINEYHPILSTAETYLQNMIDNTEPAYAQAYKPWLKELRDLCVGVYMMSKDIPLKNPQSLLDALEMFTFDSALQLLHDVCITCKLQLKKDWLAKLREDINNMLFAAAVLTRGQETDKAR